MQNSASLKKGDRIHHFNIIESGSESDVCQICETILNFQTSANPNYFYQKFDTFLVDDARELIDRQNRKHKNNEQAVFAIACGSINVQAQNALLKILEESKSSNYFFLLIPQTSNLLPTFLSRAVIYKNQEKQKSVDYNFPNLNELKEISLKKRMDLVTKWTTDLKKEKIQKSQLKEFLSSVIEEFSRELLNNSKDSADTTIKARQLKNINQTAQYFDNNGSHIKSILEFLMLNIN